MALELFDFVDRIFNKKKFTAADCTNSDKKKHFFMAQRFISIKYPVEANNFNRVDINQVGIMNIWNGVLDRLHGQKPSWIFIKVDKKDKAKEKIKDKIASFDSEVISFYLKNKKMDRRDFDFLVSINPDELSEELKKIENHLKN